MNTLLHKKIMRRVYYSYAVSFAEHPMLWRGMFVGAAAVLLADWLHVASIMNNFFSVSVRDVPTFVTNAFVNAALHGELLTVILFVTAGLVALSSLYKLAKELSFHTSSVRTA